MSAEPTIPGLTDLERIGLGGFATVYRAVQSDLGRPVAVKVLNGHITDDDARGRFEREARAAGRLSDHPYVVPIHASGVTEQGRPFLVMDYLPDGSLGDRLRATGALSLAEAVGVGVKIAGALETAHRSGILHRDVKPDNVLVSRWGEPLLGDFGIASMVGGYETKSGSMAMSLGHAAPEVMAAAPGFKPTPLTDVYSLGSTVFNLLAGRLAFPRGDGELIQTMLARVATEPVPDLRLDGVPTTIATVIEQAMAKDPAKRQPTALQFAVELRQAAAAAGIAVDDPVVDNPRALGSLTRVPPGETTVRSDEPTITDGPRRVRPPLILVAAAVVAVALLIGGLMWALAPDGDDLAAEPEPTTTLASDSSTSIATTTSADATTVNAEIDHSGTSTAPVTTAAGSDLTPGTTGSTSVPRPATTEGSDGSPVDLSFLGDAVPLVESSSSTSAPTPPVTAPTAPATTEAPDLVSVPDVVGMQNGAAANEITRAGLVPDRVPMSCPGVADGVVCSTNPPAGRAVPRGTTVTYVVSDGT